MIEAVDVEAERVSSIPTGFLSGLTSNVETGLRKICSTIQNGFPVGGLICSLQMRIALMLVSIDVNINRAAS